MKPKLRIIGDVHGRYENYIKACKESERSVQVGDLIKDCHLYENCYENSGLDPNQHQFFGGNHDNYDIIDQCIYHLGDYGHFEIEGLGVVFFMRGAFSIDHKTRYSKPTPVFDDAGYLSSFHPKDFWPDKEELNLKQCFECLDLYKEIKPDILLSHECPFFFLSEVTSPNVTKYLGYSNNLIKTKTNLTLDAMYRYHRPKYHLFGHYHHWKSKSVDGTTLVCIPIMGAVDFYLDKVVPLNIGPDKYSQEIANVVL